MGKSKAEKGRDVEKPKTDDSEVRHEKGRDVHELMTDGDEVPRDIDVREVGKHVLFACVIGVVGAAASIVLSLAVDFAGTLVVRMPWMLYLLPVFGVLSMGLYRLFRLPINLATDTVIDDMRANKRIPALLAPGILLGTCLSVAGGGSVGKEAAVMQMGASLGSTVGRLFRLQPIRRSQRDVEPHGYTASCGMAAAFSALFFAPLGSTMFVLELTRFKHSISRHIPTMLLGAFVAFFIARAIGIGDVIPRVEVPAFSWQVVSQCLVVGVSCAVAGSVFASSLRLLRGVVRKRIAHPVISVVSGGLLFAGLVLLFGWQSFQGTGMPLLQGALTGDAAGADFAIKALLTVLALGFGFKGGEIMPMFTIGALLGCALGHLTGFSPVFSAAIGLAAFFAAASRCPLAAILMGAEIFGFAAAPALVLTVVVAYVGSRDAGVFGHGLVGFLIRLRHDKELRSS